MKGTFLDNIPWLKSHQPPLISTCLVDYNYFSSNYVLLKLPNLLKLYGKLEYRLSETIVGIRIIDVQRSIYLTTFWMEARTEYPTISVTALRFLMVFTTTYLCERTFSTLVFLKNKYRNQLNVESDLRLKTSSFNPDIDVLVQ